MSKAKFALEGKKWLVENQDGAQDLKIKGEKENSVYLYKCNNTVLQISGKVNQITLDQCRKTGVVFDDCVSTVEVITSKKVQVQAKGKVPSVQVDNSEGVQVYLSEASIDVEVFQSKSGEINLYYPDGGKGDGDLLERPLPEQFKSFLKDGKLVTETIKHA